VKTRQFFWNKFMKIFITGARGFVGRNLTDELKRRGIPYFRYDSEDGWDLADKDKIKLCMEGCDTVIHLAANASIRNGWENPRRDLDVNLLGTINVLEAMTELGIRTLGFASSSAIYGDTDNPSEDCPWPKQTSLYGASKVAAEAFIQAYAEKGHIDPYIFRFAPVLGEHYRYGVVFDFVKQLTDNKSLLTIRGDGTTRKSFIYSGDLVIAMLHLINGKHMGAFNLCTPESCTVTQVGEWVCETMDARPQIVYLGGDKGWIGDAKNLNPNPAKLYATGWRPTLSIHSAMQRAVKSIEQGLKNETKKL
jgi:UDP-glucose 4-epimerase